MRRKSLSIDKNDQEKLRHGRVLHEGTPLGGEFFQICPYFFSREGASLNLVGHYRGAAAFLLAGGPSVKTFNLSRLRNAWVMTLNNVPATFRGQANCTVDDPCRFNLSTWLDPLITKFVPLAHFEKPLWDNRRLAMLADGRWEQKWERSAVRVGDCPNVVGYRRNEKFHAPRWLHEDTVNWGNHKKYGGGRSVLLAALRILFLLGFRRVYLLGVDFEMTEESKYHFAEERTATAIRGNMVTYAKLQGWFAELQPHFLKAGYIIHNCYLKSRLTAFPFLPYEQALEDATAHLGDYTRERTAGMYRKFEEKLKEGEQTTVVNDCTTTTHANMPVSENCNQE